MQTQSPPTERAAPVAQPNYITAITTILAEKGHPYPNVWEQGLHPDAFTTPDPGVQRFLINRYWRQQLGSLTIDTKDERYCLGDVGDAEGWIQTFRDLVAKCIVKYNLPALIH